MIRANEKSSRSVSAKRSQAMSSESGAALATAILMLALLSAIAMTVLAVVRNETLISGSDMKRTQTFYASSAGIEKMTSDFCALYQQTSRPTDAQVASIASLYPTELLSEGFTLAQTAVTDDVTLAAMRTTQGLVSPALPQVTMPSDSAFSGLIATVKPYSLTSTATAVDGTQVTLTRNMNNYMIPLFQFGMFSDEDIELHPGATFIFNGRVHANGNVYVSGLVKFLDKVTSAHELIYDKLRNGEPRNTNTVVSMGVGPTSAINVPLTKGSMVDGPYILGQTSGQPNYFPGSPTGTVWTPSTFVWKTTSVQAADGSDNKFGGQLLTRTTGASKLELPMQLDGNPTLEIIKRRMPNDSVAPPALPSALSDSRYHTKAKIRILIDDEGVANDVAGLYGTQNGDGTNAHNGVNLSSFDPMMLPNATVGAGGGRALWRINGTNTSSGNSYNEATTTIPSQQQFPTPSSTPVQADTVRGVKAGPFAKLITGANSANPLKITCVAHGFSTGDQVVISGVQGNANANGKWTITRVDADHFTLNGQSGVSGYVANTGYVYSSAAFALIPRSTNNTAIAPGAGLTGHILIQIVDANGVWRDVTREILSMGMTVGEPNAIVQLQRPMWAAFTQGSRDGSTLSTTPNPALNGDNAYANSLTDIINNTHLASDGQIKITSTAPSLADPQGYLTSIVDDTASGAQPQRSDVFPALDLSAFDPRMWNSIVPINVYNVREGRLSTSASSLTSDANQVYERGMTNVVEINMKNLSRWLDGVYDTNLLASTTAVSTNIAKPDGYVVYVSDRRGDNLKTVFLKDPATGVPSTTSSQSTNGMVDNVDIYGPNNTMDTGEDVQNTGATGAFTSITKDITEVPDPSATWSTLAGNATTLNTRRDRALAVAAWSNPSGYFRRAVRLFNAEVLQTAGAPRANLSTTVGITISSENMVYTWGNYNTTGINVAPGAGLASLNDPAAASRYTGNQVPTSIVADAWFPLSKTWADSLSSMYPDDTANRPADRVASGTIAATDETSVRAGIIAGNNLGAMAALPDAGNNTSTPSESRLNGGMHNFPRFLEKWTTRYNFVGALIPLYRSTQALGPYNASSTIYGAPVRNWAFDTTFRDPLRLPPGTPQFQHIEPTGFRQIL